MRDGDGVDHFRRSTRNYFSAGGLDRATLLRPREEWLGKRLSDAATRIVPIWRSLTLLQGDSAPRAVLLSPPALRAGGFDCGAAILLGVRAEVAYFALDLLADEAALARVIPGGARFRELRDAGPLLDAEAGAMLAYARAITYWHARHRHCGNCGAATRIAEAGHLRVCGDPHCGQKHFPRTDPAIIVLVLHRDTAGADESKDGRGRAKHDCRDAGGRAMHGAIAEDARADESRAGIVPDNPLHSRHPWRSDGRGRAKHAMAVGRPSRRVQGWTS